MLGRSRDPERLDVVQGAQQRRPDLLRRAVVIDPPPEPLLRIIGIGRRRLGVIVLVGVGEPERPPPRRLECVVVEVLVVMIHGDGDVARITVNGCGSSGVWCTSNAQIVASTSCRTSAACSR